MAVTQKDIAKALNVSQGMVSGVLGNKPNVWGSAANRQMILDQAQRMGYRPNTAARRLRRGTSENVGMIVLNQSGEPKVEIGDIATVVASFLDGYGYDLNLKIFTDLERLLSGLSTLVRAKACDIFILCSPSQTLPPQVALLNELKMSYIVVSSLEDESPACPQIDFDHPWLIRTCIEHLVSRGHRRLAYLGHNNDEFYARRLRDAFVQVYEETFGEVCDESLIGRSSIVGDRSAQVLVSEWIALEPERRPTAIVMGASDNISWCGIEIALAKHGMRIGDGPGKIAVAGLHLTEDPLILGEAYAFSNVRLSNMAERLCESLLEPMLHGRAPEVPHIRVRAALEPLHSMHLLDQVATPIC